jgi:hypothetical protein
MEDRVCAISRRCYIDRARTSCYEIESNVMGLDVRRKDVGAMCSCALGCSPPLSSTRTKGAIMNTRSDSACGMPANGVSGGAEIISEEAERLQRYNEQGIDLCRVEALILFADSLCDTFARQVKGKFDELFSNRVPNVQQTGGELFATLSNMRKTIDFVDEVVRSTQASYIVTNAPALDWAKEKLRVLRLDLEKRWPLFDEEELKRGCQSADRGELLDPEVILRELESSPDA